MEAKELMINDWVLTQFINGNDYATIQSLDKNCADIECRGHFYTHDYVGFFPIPLTKEILEANGWEGRMNVFEKLDKDYYIRVNFYNDNTIKLFVTIIGATTTGIPIKYVHELQHSLRLCGLNDIADNFKIE